MSDSTYIDSGLKLRGLFKAPGQLVVIAGTFEGELEARDLIIEAGGHCQGFVQAETVAVEGKFTGILETESLNVGEAGIVAGEITTDALVVDPEQISPVHLYENLRWKKKSLKIIIHLFEQIVT